MINITVWEFYLSSASFLYNADLGCSKYTFSNFPSSLHDFTNSVVFLFTLWDGKDCFMPWWIKLFSLGVELSNTISLQCCVHIILSQLHTLHNLFKVILDCLNICVIFDFDLLDEVLCTFNVISDIDYIFSEFSDSIFSCLVNLLFISLNCVIVFCQLVN